MANDQDENFREEHHKTITYDIGKNTLALIFELLSPQEHRIKRIETKVDLILDWIEQQRKLHRAVGFQFIIKLPDGKILIKENNFNMAFRKNEQFDVTLKPVDANGDATTLDGAPTWESSDTSVATVTPDADNPLKAKVQTSATNTGSAVITATGDGDLDSGEGEVTQIVATGLVTVLGNDAVGAELEFGAATPVEPVPTP